MIPTNILVPVDFSACAEHALDYACDLAARLGARIHVINAIGAHHWYFQWAAYLFIGAVMGLGAIYYFAVYNRKPIEVLSEHSAQYDLAEPAIAEVAP